MKRAILPLALLVSLAACVSFGDKPPETLMTLRSADQVTAGQGGQATSANSLVVATPSTAQMIDTDRVAVRTTDTSIAYLKNARWAEPPARLFADLLSEVIAARTDRVVIDRRQYALAPGARLSGKLEAFELDTMNGEAVVIFNAILAVGDGKPLATRRFEAHVKTASEKPTPVGRALNDAANEVAAAIADWVKADGSTGS